MKFWKYHGIGNDFIVLDCISDPVPVDPAWCEQVCDRHFGIGADGVLYILPGEKGTDITMRIINADSSEAEMCGNGIRCVAKHAADTGLVSGDEFTIMTGRGVLKAKVRKDPEDDYVSFVQIDMGAPILDGRQVPVDFDGRFIDQPFECDGVKFRGNAVSMGNPHFITFSDISDEDVRRLGPQLEKHPFFPRKTNVEFARVKDGKIEITVYERGAAWTLACGTGACATTVAAALNKLVPFDEPIDVRLPGGWLKITADSKLRYVLMEGPAELVYTGETDYLR
ncbi:diaminopimelate epimerase [Thermoplasmatales archaeon BRNA1]|nr:diaminopimelate epimerase [Thermoplasmatales archaeon BRNA1]